MAQSSRKALLVVAHGSRRESSNEEVRAVARRVASLSEGAYDQVMAAFLELVEPSIPEGICRCHEMGADTVMVLPYFLSAGRHVAMDIPREVELGRQRCPEARVVLCDYFGGSDAIPDLVLDVANRSG
jgi:sirohydrochlorin ferrochelatase